MTVRSFCSLTRAVSALALFGILYITFQALSQSTDPQVALQCIPPKLVEPLSCPDAKHYPPKEKAKYAVVTFNTQETSYTVLSLKNKQRYAQRHGYDFIVDYEADLKPTASGIWWHKFNMAKRLLQSHEYEWIWWIDFDSLITNMSIPLMSIINEALAAVDNPQEVDFLLNDDCNKLNAGSMIIRSTPTALATTESVIEYGEQHNDLSDQGAFLQIINSNNLAQRPFSPDPVQNTLGEQAELKHVKARTGKGSVVMMPQYKFNAFPEEIGCYDSHQKKWEPGMFVVHFAGAWAHIKEKDAYGVMMRRYEGKVVDR